MCLLEEWHVRSALLTQSNHTDSLYSLQLMSTAQTESTTSLDLTVRPAKSTKLINYD